MSDPRASRVLIGACGSADVLNLPAYLTALRQHADLEVRVCMTGSAARFIPVESIRYVAHEAVAQVGTGWDCDHIGWADWADLTVVLPTTAHMLFAMAHGAADSLLATMLLAHDRPITFFPSMNQHMLDNSAVRRNIEQLRQDGHVVVEPTPSSVFEVSAARCVQQPAPPAPDLVSEYVRRATSSRRISRRAAPVGDIFAPAGRS